MARRAVQNAGSNEERETSRRIGVLKALWPFMRPYRGMIFAALGALTLTAGVSLSLPLAVRRVVDNFRITDAALLNQYFTAAMIMAALLAFGTGLRYALVTKLGERVVADIRKAVFDRIIGMPRQGVSSSCPIVFPSRRFLHFWRDRFCLK